MIRLMNLCRNLVIIGRVTSEFKKKVRETFAATRGRNSTTDCENAPLGFRVAPNTILHTDLQICGTNTRRLARSHPPCYSVVDNNVAVSAETL